MVHVHNYDKFSNAEHFNTLTKTDFQGSDGLDKEWDFCCI